MKFFEKESRLITILVLFSASLFLVGLGKMPLTDPDEVFYAETAKEMLNRGEFLTPYIFGSPQFEKPPLYYWLVISGFKVFGVNGFGARVPSALFGILGIVGIYFLGKILANRETGFFAGIVLATSVIYAALSRACVTDIVLGVLILYAFLFFFHRRYLLSSVFLGLAVLTKGPVGVLLPVAIMAAYVLSKERERAREIPFLRAAVLFFAVAAPWYFLMYKVHGKQFIDVFFGFHNVTRFLKPEHAIGDVFYYYIPVVIGGFFPWVLFLPLAIWQGRREADGRIRKANFFLAVWFFVILVFFSLSRTKLPTYIFPLFPALALLTGRLLDIFVRGGFTAKQKKAMDISLLLFIISLIGGLAGIYAVAGAKYPTVSGIALVLGGAFTVFMLIFAVLFLKGRYMQGIVVFTASFIIFIYPLSYALLPEIGRYESGKHISEKLLTFVKPGEKVGAETRYRRGIAFYMNREDIIDVHPHDVITRLLRGDERIWCVIKEKNHIQLYTDRKKPFEKPTYVVYKFGKKVVITNKKPRDLRILKTRSADDPY